MLCSYIGLDTTHFTAFLAGEVGQIKIRITPQGAIEPGTTACCWGRITQLSFHVSHSCNIFPCVHTALAAKERSFTSIQLSIKTWLS